MYQKERDSGPDKSTLHRAHDLDQVFEKLLHAIENTE